MGDSGMPMALFRRCFGSVRPGLAREWDGGVGYSVIQFVGWSVGQWLVGPFAWAGHWDGSTGVRGRQGPLRREFGLVGNNERRSRNLGNHKGCPYRCLDTGWDAGGELWRGWGAPANLGQDSRQRHD